MAKVSLSSNCPQPVYVIGMNGSDFYWGEAI
jgi:hypothetical protein